MLGLYWLYHPPANRSASGLRGQGVQPQLVGEKADPGNVLLGAACAVASRPSGLSQGSKAQAASPFSLRNFHEDRPKHTKIRKGGVLLKMYGIFAYSFLRLFSLG